MSGAVNSGNTISASAVRKGYGGDIKVTLEVTDGTITNCKIIGKKESPDIGARAIQKLQEQILSSGSVKVDGISGATVTTRAIQGAATMAFNDAIGAQCGEVKMKPGKYTASALGYWGIWKLPVTITVDEKTLLKIEVPEDRFAHGETEIILQSVIDKLFPRMLENQSVNVDAIAGATVSSNAVLTSVESALKEALKEGGAEDTAIFNFYKAPEMPALGEIEELETDLLIVGMNTGSMLAMRSAMDYMMAHNGHKRISILAIDKAGKYGGKSALIHEIAAVNPKRLSESMNDGKKFVDEDRFLQEWLHYTSNDGVQSAKEDVIRMFFEESGKTIDWMYELGWLFGTNKKSDMTDGMTAFNQVLTSNIDVGTYEDRRGIVDTYYKLLLAAVVAQGGKYMLETEGYDFILDEETERKKKQWKRAGYNLTIDADTIKGVRARNNVTGKEYIIRAKAVIMATGGFASNDKMMTELIDPRYAGPRKVLGTGMDDGKMIAAALNAGAGTWNIDMQPLVMHFSLSHYLTHYPVNVRENTLNGRTGRNFTWTLNDMPLGMGLSADTIFVDKNGKRFSDESIVSKFATEPDMDSWCGAKAGQYYYAIYSKEQMDVIAKEGLNSIRRWEGYCSQGGIPAELPLPEVYECMDICVDEGIAWKGDTLASLEEQLGMPAGALSNTVLAYNKNVASGVDAEFGKDPRWLKPIGSGPYYAIQIHAVAFASCGGLDVDTQIRVLQRDHKTPIKGLYAIGNDSLGVLMNGKRNYVGFGGIAQGWVVTAGRLAGINASRYIHENYGLADVSPALVNMDSKIY